MAEPISIQQLKDASEDAISLAEFINKPENAMIPRRLSSDIHSLQYYLEYMKSFAQRSYETYDEMVANASNLTENVSVFVTNDLDTSNNGIYTYNGTSFVRGEYQPENAAKDFVEAKLGGLEVFDGKVRAQDVSTVDGSTQAVKNTEFRNELDALPFEDGVLADTFITVEEQITGEGTLNIRDFNSRTILAVNSIAELLQVKAISGRVVFVKGSQGGVFIYDSSKSAIDDGGLVINGWVRQLQTPYITPEMFGCVGDGINDDTINLNRFGAVNYRYKRAAKQYKVSAPINIAVTLDASIIDLGASTLVGTPNVYSIIELTVTGLLKTLHISTGNYDGGEVVNSYMTAQSAVGSSCDYVQVDCKGTLKNFSNTNNTRGTTGLRVAITSRHVVVNNPKVSNVYNINGINGISSATGVTVVDFTELGVVNNPVIDGVYTSTGVDADGVVLFEKKGVATTGTALAVVNQPILRQTCGRGIKSQCNLKVRGMKLDLEPPTKGVILETSWRGVDAQLGELDAHDIIFNLDDSCFPTITDASLFSSSGTGNAQASHSISKVRIRGLSKIKYLAMLTTNNHKSITINDVIAETYQGNLNILYLVSNNASELISITNINGSFSPTNHLLFDSYMTGVCNNLVISNVPSFPSYIINLDKFTNVLLNTPNNAYSGAVDYTKIDKRSHFLKHIGEISNISTTQAIAGEFKSYSTYVHGNLINLKGDKKLTSWNNGVFYVVSLPTAVIAPNKP